MTRASLMTTTLLALLLVVLSSVAFAADAPLLTATVPADAVESATQEVYAQPTDPVEPTAPVKPLPPPKLSAPQALQRLYYQFPHLQKTANPKIELSQYDTPAYVLSVYTYTWPDTNLIVEQNGDTGDILQYADLDNLRAAGDTASERRISQGAAQMLATARMKRVLSPEALTHYPEAPEVMSSANGVYMFFWIRHYQGIPYYRENLMIAVHPGTGMTVAILDQRDYSINTMVTLPEKYLNPDDATALVLERLKPVLIDLQLDEGQDPVQVWFSGITVDSFEASGKDLLEMTPEAGTTLKEGQVLLVDEATATKRFSESLDLKLQWATMKDEDLLTANPSELVLIYSVTFHPMKDSPIAVIPATIGEAEFISTISMEN